MARTGLCARGLIYAVLAVITADIATSGGRGERASSTGAIEELVRQPAGPILVAILAVGLAAYAAWRWLQAASADPDVDGANRLARRAGWAASGFRVTR